jgi:starch synthase
MPVKILFATPEAVPYFKTGGLADVARALPDELVKRGHDVHVMMPLYRGVRERPMLREPAGSAVLPWPGQSVNIEYSTHAIEGQATTLFADAYGLFDTNEPYTGETAFLARRFGIFCRAVAERARALQVDVVHINDWPTGLVPLYTMLDGGGPPTVFAIHNLAYQGNFPRWIVPQLGIPDAFFRTENGLEFYGEVSFMKGGLALSDRLVTVSPTYAREIQTPEFGAGMDGLLRFRRRVLHGILNGIDPRTWDPATDSAIPARYSAAKQAGKETCRTALLEELGIDDGGPLFIAITRLAYQKGIDLLIEALPALLDMEARLIVLGDGDAGLEYALSRAVVHNPKRVAAFFRFDDGLARRLYAGGDFFLMPSRYEPCGLGQMIAQRYGTIPIVRHTGGLVDTVEQGITGFAFGPPTAKALTDACKRARAFWRGEDWEEMRERCMGLDRSWHRSAGVYEEVYRLATGHPAG